MNKTERIKSLVVQLNEARKAYYAEDREIMSNLEYDKLYEELEALEQETGMVLANSPTQEVGYEAVDELPKERHESPMLSLDKTKDVEALRTFIGDQKTLLSWKMDGLTVVLTYQGGHLVKAVTRGNGVIGEVVTNNARVFQNIPLKIPYEGEVILRGEAIITYSDFEKINAGIEDVDAKYKNPRNLCSGSVRQLNNEITAKRQVRFFAFSLVRAEGVDFQNSRACQMEWLKEQGFETVEERLVTAQTLDKAMEYFSTRITENDFPSDGLVAIYDDIAYGESLGSTAKFPRNAYAFKWADEQRETILKEIEWSPSRTGLINPVAIFEPVELEGTTVSRASVHNVSIMKELELGIGDRILVYKANMIIPQIANNLTRSGNPPIAKVCPVCKEKTTIHKENGVESLFCENKNCLAKKIKSISHFVSRDAMNIDGMSEATIEKLIAIGALHRLGDLFRIQEHKDEIIALEGFGEKSYQKLLQALVQSKHTTTARFLYSLGVPNIGPANAKMIVKALGQDFERIRQASVEDLVEIEGVGEVIAQAFVAFFENDANKEMIDDLLTVVTLEKEEQTNQVMDMEGLQFVITGSVNHFANRKEVKELIEQHGGKVTGSVTGKTSYLINNDNLSRSSKNKKANELGIPIISEETFLELVNQEES